MMKNTFLIFKYAQHNFTFNVENEVYDLYGEKKKFSIIWISCLLLQFFI